MDSLIKNWIKNNNNLLAIMYIILVIIILFSLLDMKEVLKYNKKIKEGFEVTNKVENMITNVTEKDQPDSRNIRMKKPVHNILCSIEDPNMYFGAYLSYKKASNHIDNFVYTNSLASNEWLKSTENLSLSDSHVIIDLTFDSSKRLTAVGLKMNKKGQPE